MNKIAIKKGLDAIASQDKEINCALKKIGYPKDRQWPTGFETFVSIIVSQQLSTIAADAILNRVHTLLPELTPDKLLSKRITTLRKVGLSEKKVEYLRGLSLAIKKGEFSPDALKEMDDETAIKSICNLHGLGEWSAEIYLMFSLGRRDIFPANDLALQIALQNLKKLKEKPSAKVARKLVESWAPNRSYGSLFLWRYYQKTKSTDFSL
ncbi:MAG: DNA-3-methyladenine glycosylase 2 family protein [Pseudomonadota bacterium]